jgi:hypothetical protein
MKIRLIQKGVILALLGLASSLACNSLVLRAKPALKESAPEMIILTDVLQKMDGCQSDVGVTTENNTYSFSCMMSADTSYTISITRFNSKADAQKQFDLGRGENPVQCFHGYDLYEMKSQNPNNQYIQREQLEWQASQWVLSTSAIFDYGYFHYTATDFSEAIYGSGVEHHLIAARACPTKGTGSP